MNPHIPYTRTGLEPNSFTYMVKYTIHCNCSELDDSVAPLKLLIITMCIIAKIIYHITSMSNNMSRIRIINIYNQKYNYSLIGSNHSLQMTSASFLEIRMKGSMQLYSRLYLLVGLERGKQRRLQDVRSRNRKTTSFFLKVLGYYLAGLML